MPDEFHGWPIGPLPSRSTYHVEVTTPDEWLRAQLGFDPLRGIAIRHWLSVPQQVVLRGHPRPAVFHDGLGDLTIARETLAGYPDDVWLWLMACQWRRLDQEEPVVARAAEVEDELGSRVVAARLARDVMRMCFLQERR